MACALHPAPGTEVPDSGFAEPVPFTRPVPLPMTRCECAEVAFEEIARRMEAEGASLEEVGRRTGCGTTCTACLPDLRRFLASR